MARDRSRPPSASYHTAHSRWAEQRKAQADAEAQAVLEKYQEKITTGNYTDADYQNYISELSEIQNRFFNDLVHSLE